MKILVIDSHKGSEGETPTNLHWTNAEQIASYLGADLIWSYPSVNDNIKGGYDRIVFVHASPYSYVDKEWINKSPDAELFYITNEYNLGEPTILWRPAKAGRHYTVIANHEPDISKIVTKYTKGWCKVNLNSLVFRPQSSTSEDMFGNIKQGIVYYGSFRKGRVNSFKKYLNGNVVISTHPKNVEKFQNIGVQGRFIPRINWNFMGLHEFAASLYIEDDVTHDSYNFLANRFYEALSYHVPTVFTRECENTIRLSNYHVTTDLLISDPNQLGVIEPYIPSMWYHTAETEKREALEQIERIVT